MRTKILFISLLLAVAGLASVEPASAGLPTGTVYNSSYRQGVSIVKNGVQTKLYPGQSASGVTQYYWNNTPCMRVKAASGTGGTKGKWNYLGGNKVSTSSC